MINWKFECIEASYEGGGSILNTDTDTYLFLLELSMLNVIEIVVYT